MLNIILLEPEIPQNTGNISRTCAATHTALHLIEPMGFQIDDRRLKRAGLDYWHLVSVTTYADLEAFWAKHPTANPWLASTKAKQAYHQVAYQPDDWIMFGKETRGLPETLLAERYDRTIRIPMREEARSLNLSNSVAVVLYEALRQLNFPHLTEEGHLSLDIEGKKF